MKKLLAFALFITILNSCTKDEDISPIAPQIEMITNILWRIDYSVDQKTELTCLQYYNNRKNEVNGSGFIIVDADTVKITARLRKLEQESLNKKMKLKISVTTYYSTGRQTVKADSVIGINQYLSMSLEK